MDKAVQHGMGAKGYFQGRMGAFMEKVVDGGQDGLLHSRFGIFDVEFLVLSLRSSVFS